MAVAQRQWDLRKRARRERRVSVGPVAQILLFAVFVSAAAVAYWAKDVTLVSLVQGNGVVAPFDVTRRVLSPIGGRLAAHEIRDGMVVEKGQVLFRIENAEETAAIGALRSKILALQAAAARLEAEATGAESVAFPENLNGQAAAAKERDSFDFRRAQLAQRLQTLRDSAAQILLNIAEQKAAVGRYGRARKLAQKELEILRPLVTRGISPQLESLRVQQKIQDLEAQREDAALAIPRLETALRESKRLPDEAVAAFRADARRELNETQAELTAARRSIYTAATSVAATEVHAPTRGVVRKLFVGNDGDTIRPDQALLELAPLAVPLFVEVQVSVADRANLQLGQKATVRQLPSAAASSRGGAAVLVAIGSDALLDKTGKRTYEVRLRLDADDPSSVGLAVPGLAVRVEIGSGEEAMLDYVMGPIVRRLEFIR